MLHVAFTEEECSALHPHGWCVYRHITDPCTFWVLKNDTAKEAPLVDPTAALWMVQEALRPPVWTPSSDGVLADTVRPGGQTALLFSQDGQLLYNALCPHGKVQPLLKLECLSSPHAVHTVIRSGVDRQVGLLSLVLIDDQDLPFLLDMPLKTAALAAAYNARKVDALSEVSPAENKGPEDATSH